MRLIGLTGLAGAGKDTVADFLRETQGFVGMAFADPLRAGLQAMFGLTPEQLNDRESKEAPIDWLGASPRRLMQTLGTEWGRTFVAKDVWLRTAQQTLERFRRAEPCLHIEGVVVTDVRFRNEADWIVAQGGEVWRIVRPAPTLIGEPAAHVSECGNVYAHKTIFNTGTIEDLHAAVAATLFPETETRA